MLPSSSRLQPIKYDHHHPLITISTLAGNRSEQAATVDKKLTQIHQDEVPFFSPALINRGLSMNRPAPHADSLCDVQRRVSVQEPSMFPHAFSDRTWMHAHVLGFYVLGYPRSHVLKPEVSGGLRRSVTPRSISLMSHLFDVAASMEAVVGKTRACQKQVDSRKCRIRL